MLIVLKLNAFYREMTFIFIWGLNLQLAMEPIEHKKKKLNKLIQGIKNEKENNFILRNTRMIFHCLEEKNKETDWRL
jgi:hypothetical protein